jgi:hypothetical protein
MSKQLIKKNGFEALEVFEPAIVDSSSDNECTTTHEIVAVKSKKKNRRRRNKKPKPTMRFAETVTVEEIELSGKEGEATADSTSAEDNDSDSDSGGTHSTSSENNQNLDRNLEAVRTAHLRYSTLYSGPFPPTSSQLQSKPFYLRESQKVPSARKETKRLRLRLDRMSKTRVGARRP